VEDDNRGEQFSSVGVSLSKRKTQEIMVLEAITKYGASGFRVVRPKRSTGLKDNGMSYADTPVWSRSAWNS